MRSVPVAVVAVIIVVDAFVVAVLFVVVIVVGAVAAVSKTFLDRQLQNDLGNDNSNSRNS